MARNQPQQTSIVAVGVLSLALLGGCTGGPASPSSAAPPPSLAGTPAVSGSPQASAPPDDEPTSSPITSAQAIAAVKAFAPTATGLEVAEDEEPGVPPAYRVTSDDIIAMVDEATGRVTMFLDNAAMPTSPAVTLREDAALAKATAWLAAHSVDTAGLTPTTELIDHGSTQEYQVVFQARMDGVRLPHRVDVSVNPATGDVYGFVLFSRAYTPPPKPVLTREQAIAAAREEEADPDAKVTATDLAVAFDATGAQLLVYELDLTRTDGFYAKVQVDALTGAVTVLGRG